MLLSSLLPLLLLQACRAQVLNPPYFNLATGREVTATSTCGEGTPGERYCILTGANTDEKERQRAGTGGWHIENGQLCNRCNRNVPELNHEPVNTVDGTKKSWQSPPLSRGSSYNEVNLTVNLGQEYHVAYVFIRMGNSPRPGVWALERSVDNGLTFQPWQYFADSPAECKKYFGVNRYDGDPMSDEDILCITKYSKVVPLENGEIPISLVQDRPGSVNFTYSPTLQEFTKATHVQLRLLRTQTLQGDLMAVARQDPTVTRRYFYSIRDISIGGRCVCNGHAESCNKPTITGSQLQCDCQHNTCGSQCDTCCEGFVQKKWRKATDTSNNSCEPCRCFGHAASCVYNETVDALSLSMDTYGNFEGGGVCQDCQHHTEGVNCETCVFGYYRPSFKRQGDTDACQECRCDTTFTTGDCQDGDGQCVCKPQYTGVGCEQCAVGYINYPECRPCDCFLNGTASSLQCTFEFGQCTCKPNFGGIKCDTCDDMFYDFPDCVGCDCMSPGSQSEVCDKDSGACLCGYNFGGHRCDRCQHGYYSYPSCATCNCDSAGTVEEVCDKTSGQCMCKPNFSGQRCDRCAEGFFNYPACTACECDSVGSEGEGCSEQGFCACRSGFGDRRCDVCAVSFYRYPDCLSCGCELGAEGKSCSGTGGQCTCKSGFTGRVCDSCGPNLYNYPVCEACNCNPAGAMEKSGFPLGGCGSFQDGTLCECKAKVNGHTCDECMPGTWGLIKSNPDGCSDCQCHRPGTLSGSDVCDPVSGQCSCKPNVESRRCHVCSDGFFMLEAESLYGCQDCGCDVGGSTKDPCDKSTGECSCLPHVTGPRCTKPNVATYFPGFYHLRYELEDGYTPLGGSVRYGYDESLFPGFSWRGYATLSYIQPEVRIDIEVNNPSVYRLVVHYVNRNSIDVTGTFTVDPIDSAGNKQFASVQFEPTLDGPKKKMTASSFVLDAGRWSVALSTPEDIHVDFIALLPREYYEATLLREKVRRPCSFEDERLPCLVYTYVDISQYPSISSDDAFDLGTGRDTLSKTYVYPTKVLWPNSVELEQAQPVTFRVAVLNSDQYILVVSYSSALYGAASQLMVEAGTVSQRWMGSGSVYGCNYDEVCRSVITDSEGLPMVMDLDSGSVRVTVSVPAGTDPMEIHSVTLIPTSHWDIELITPRVSHARINPDTPDNGFSVAYAPVPDSIRVEAESNPNEHRIAPIDTLPPSLSSGDDSATTLAVVLVSSTDGDLSVTADVTEPGQFAVIVHYYQPLSIGFQVSATVTVNGLDYYGTLNLEFCPSHVGCRAVAQFPSAGASGAEMIDLVGDSVDIEIGAHSDKIFWVDYMLLVPKRRYHKENIVGLEPADLSSQFIANCAGPQGNFDWSSMGGEEFNRKCESAVFSLTTSYNYGAIECECKIQGVVNTLECMPFQGQCDCKDNVIGRDCSACASGFYGYPKCTKCECPALCHATTGECICPPRVTGENCTECEAETYAYDPNIGCNDCLCTSRGVLNGNLTCDVNTGKCQCKPNVVGRQCDRCEVGFWGFPDCHECLCDRSGSEAGVCDQSTGMCLCRANVEGDRCDTCKPGTFSLDARKSEGCTGCDCSGVTRSCSGSTFQLNVVDEMKDWRITSFENVSLVVDDRSVTAIYPNGSSAEPAYFTAPLDFVGNKVLSYGGKMRFELEYDILADVDAVPGPVLSLVSLREDLTMSSKNTQPYFRVKRSTREDFTFTLIESEFVYGNGGGQASRGDFIRLLSSLSEVLIKANPYRGSNEVTLGNVELEVAVSDLPLPTLPSREATTKPYTTMDPTTEAYVSTTAMPLATSATLLASPESVTASIEKSEGSGMISETDMDSMFSLRVRRQVMTDPDMLRMALDVEVCSCPPSYTGSSCESCAPGFFRRHTPTRPICAPCECHGHAETCDPETGVCLDCEGNTEGDTCNVCKLGYYGNALTGGGCTICTCPMNTTSNNFALTCTAAPGTCVCQDGYEGPACSRCAPGHFGQPTVAGSSCNLCECNGNSDLSDVNSCNTTSGVCTCINNTDGDSCDRCADLHWGDPTGSRNCTVCDCDPMGTGSCDQESGLCQCHPNVVGEKCDQCAVGSYGFESGRGCSTCGCGIAATFLQCNDSTGQCSCSPGSTGLRCDQCEPLHWNYGTHGCISCNCQLDGAVGCDSKSGECSCLQGVTGERCDECSPRWVLEPSQGCKECDSCVHTLLDDTDALETSLGTATESLDNLSISVAVQKRLKHLNETIFILQDSFRGLGDVDKGDLDGVESALTDLEGVAGRFEPLVQTLGRAIERAELGTRSLTGATQAGAGTIDSQSEDVLKLISSVEEILSRLQRDTRITDADMLLKQAYAILIIMNNSTESLEDVTMATAEELEEAEQLLARVRDLSAIVGEQEEDAGTLRLLLLDYGTRVEDLEERAIRVNESVAQNGRTLDDINPRYKQLLKLIDDVSARIDVAGARNYSSHMLVVKAAELLSKIRQDLMTIPEAYMNDDIDRLRNFTDALVEANGKSNASVQLALDHARLLNETAQNLESLLRSPKNASEGALAAARVYSEISTKILEAWNATQGAIEDATDAITQSKDIHNTTVAVLTSSQELLDLAEGAERSSLSLADRLVSIEQGLRVLDENLMKLIDQEAEIRMVIDSYPKGEAEKAREAERVASDASVDVKDSVARAQPIQEMVAQSVQQLRDTAAFNEDIVRDTEMAQRSVSSYGDALNETVSIRNELEGNLTGLSNLQSELKDEIAALTQKILEAYKITEKVKHGVSLYENTTLELVVPSNLYDDFKMGSDLIMYFKTTDADGLLFYLGPADESISSDPEFLALSLVEGRVQYTMALGGDPSVISTKARYDDGQWHRVSFGRSSNRGDIRVDTQDRTSETETGPALQHSLLELDKRDNMTRLFIGGAPAGTVLPSPLSNTQFVGEIEDLLYSKTKVIPLWNFKDSNNVYGAVQRGSLEGVKEKAVQFFRSTNSYMTMDKGTLASRDSSKTINFDITFKTYEQDGILAFYGSNGSSFDFMMISLNGGRPTVTFELGNGIFSIEQPVLVSDGKFYKFRVMREGTQLALATYSSNDELLDRLLANQEAGDSTQLNLGKNPEIHLGGFPFNSNFKKAIRGTAHDIREPHFDGCITAFSLFDEYDLTNPLSSSGTQSGCNIVHNNIHFSADALASGEPSEVGGYAVVSESDHEVDINLKISMRIRTSSMDGLLFYQADDDETYVFSMALVGGQVKVVGKYKDNFTNLTAPSIAEGVNITDGRLHHILVEKNSSNFLIRIDDGLVESTSERMEKKHRYRTGRKFYLGGLNIRPSVEASVGTTRSYVGCIQDILINDSPINFAEIQQSRFLVLQNAMIEDCPLTDPDNDNIFSSGQSHTLQSCALPVSPDVVNGEMSGTRFGSHSDSQILLTPLTAFNASSFRLNNHQTLSFKTTSTAGILWAIADVAGSSGDAAALYMKNGRLAYAVELGSGATVIETEEAYNDNKWHTVTFSRMLMETAPGKSSSELTLTVDGENTVSGSYKGSTRSLNVVLPIFLGGLGEPQKAVQFSKLGMDNIGFDGCIKEHSLAYTNMENEVSSSYYETAGKELVNTSPCFGQQENGAFFQGSGYMSLVSNFKVGVNLEVTMEIRPRAINGVLLAARASTSRDFFVVTLLEGNVLLTVENGAGKVFAEYTAPRNVTMCNGAWHTIRVAKKGHTVSLAVDDSVPKEVVGKSSSKSADTDGDFLLGGFFDDRVLDEQKISIGDYAGCVRNVHMNGAYVDLPARASTGSVTIPCPVN